jgi:hypothetical protein
MPNSSFFCRDWLMSETYNVTFQHSSSVGGFNHLQPPFPRGYLALSGDIYGYYTGLGERSGTNVYWVETRDADKACQQCWAEKYWFNTVPLIHHNRMLATGHLELQGQIHMQHLWAKRPDIKMKVVKS